MIALALLLQVADIPVQPCAPGLYLEDLSGTMSIALTEKLTDHRKMSGLIGYALLGGLTTIKVKTVLSGAAATVRTRSPRPSFLFCAPATIEPASGSAAMGYVGVSASALSLREFRLVRFDVQGEQREVPLSAMSITGSKTGAIQKSTVRFDTREVAPNRFRATPLEDLTAGEYGFLRTTGNTAVYNGKKAAPERVYDFAVE